MPILLCSLSIIALISLASAVPVVTTCSDFNGDESGCLDTTNCMWCNVNKNCAAHDACHSLQHQDGERCDGGWILPDHPKSCKSQNGIYIFALALVGLLFCLLCAVCVICTANCLVPIVQRRLGYERIN